MKPEQFDREMWRNKALEVLEKGWPGICGRTPTGKLPRIANHLAESISLELSLSYSSGRNSLNDEIKRLQHRITELELSGSCGFPDYVKKLLDLSEKFQLMSSEIEAVFTIISEEINKWSERPESAGG